RSGGAGTPSTAGSDVTATMTRTEDDTTYSHLGSLYSPTAGSGGLDPSKSWEAYIDPANGTGTFQSNTGINPDSAVGLSGVLYEDLWETASSSFTGGKPYTYQGYFTLDAANSSLTFTPSATPVPEPGAYGIFGAAAALLLAFRRWIGLAKA
ncbi:MAG: hypothetical protein KGR98_12975, partial [Verrucomicrobia bacterium]|nr:hypothetical protein [Verrucomicrobiota bacterium]